MPLGSWTRTPGAHGGVGDRERPEDHVFDYNFDFSFFLKYNIHPVKYLKAPAQLIFNLHACVTFPACGVPILSPVPDPPTKMTRSINVSV